VATTKQAENVCERRNPAGTFHFAPRLQKFAQVLHRATETTNALFVLSNPS
jgi:hypothetical protein